MKKLMAINIKLPLMPNIKIWRFAQFEWEIFFAVFVTEKISILNYYVRN